MIRYPTRTAVIKRLVHKRHPEWQGKAIQRTQDHKLKGHYIKKGAPLHFLETYSTVDAISYSACCYRKLGGVSYQS